MTGANPIVVNAIRAVTNSPWSGNLYKCPSCKSMREFSKEGFCRKCKKKLKGAELGKFLSERIKREMRQHGLHPITGVLTRRQTGPIDIFPHDVRHMAGHPGAIQRLGMTLGAGEVGYTTEGSMVGRPLDPHRASFVHGRHVAFTRKDEETGRSRTSTSFASNPVADREKLIHKETRRR